MGEMGQRVTRLLQKRLPILQWMPKYKKEFLPADAIAGITVGLTAVPQSMAYATVAGLTPEYGLYSSFVGCFLYIFFGSCRQMAIFPSALSCLMVFQTCGENNPSCVALTSFYVGIFQVLMACLQFGAAVSLISEPVTIGFTAGAAVTVACSQLKNLLGLKGRGDGNGFIPLWKTIVNNIENTRLGDCFIGIASIFVLIALQQLKDLKPTHQGKWRSRLQKSLWYISVSRNVIVVVSSSIAAYMWSGNGDDDNIPFTLTGTVKGGFPVIKVPDFELPHIAPNGTQIDNTIMSFWETLEFLRQGPLVLAIVSILSNVAIAKSFSTGKAVDGTQEMLALGVTQIAGAFVGSIPTAGSFSRSAVNESSGVKSSLGNLFSGVLVLLSLGFITPTFYYIPKASLAAVIICAVVSLIELHILPTMWRICRMDSVICLATFIFSIFFGMEWGILVGMGVSVIYLMLQSIRPHVQVTQHHADGLDYVVITPEQRLVFPNVDFLQKTIQQVVEAGRCQILAIDMEPIFRMDYSAATALAAIVTGMRRLGQIPVVFIRLNPDQFRILEEVGLQDPPHCSTEKEVPEFLRSSSRLLDKDGPRSSSFDSSFLDDTDPA